MNDHQLLEQKRLREEEIAAGNPNCCNQTYLNRSEYYPPDIDEENPLWKEIRPSSYHPLPNDFDGEALEFEF